MLLADGQDVGRRGMAPLKLMVVFCVEDYIHRPTGRARKTLDLGSNRHYLQPQLPPTTEISLLSPHCTLLFPQFMPIPFATHHGVARTPPPPRPNPPFRIPPTFKFGPGGGVLGLKRTS